MLDSGDINMNVFLLLSILKSGDRDSYENKKMLSQKSMGTTIGMLVQIYTASEEEIYTLTGREK